MLIGSGIGFSFCKTELPDPNRGSCKTRALQCRGDQGYFISLFSRDILIFLPFADALALSFPHPLTSPLCAAAFFPPFVVPVRGGHRRRRHFCTLSVFFDHVCTLLSFPHSFTGAVSAQNRFFATQICFSNIKYRLSVSAPRASAACEDRF
ncbi:hypothetical protein SESBI_40014 [Sesbania bispinosa]|nr:hypothetical protein SESBI_40014 [Sesbania bispinosa]